ncbi:MAG: hypothetical protein KC546_13170 [Anaerolineae bacterium]|nr:hypothetical protein [Anaerolineae bacterium]
MRYITIIITLLSILAIGACSNSADLTPLPTLARLATSVQPVATATVPPTVTFIPTFTPMPSATETSTNQPATHIPATTTLPPTSTLRIIATDTVLASTPTPVPSITPTLLPDAFVFGQSVEGQALRAFRHGNGPDFIFLVGGIHAGFEANTVELVEEMHNYYLQYPEDVLPHMTLILIPSLNPDGLRHGRVIRGRFNGNEVDLNRNWSCDWSADAVNSQGSVNPGTGPFSEPETIALGGLIQQIRPKAVLFYHAAANGLFAGDCDGFSSDELAAIYGDASAYPYGEAFGEYEVTGTGPEWVASQGIQSLDVELATSSGIELERNLRGVMAVQIWLSD